METVYTFKAKMYNMDTSLGTVTTIVFSLDKRKALAILSKDMIFLLTAQIKVLVFEVCESSTPLHNDIRWRAHSYLCTCISWKHRKIRQTPTAL